MYCMYTEVPLEYRVADPHHDNADPDPAYYFNADPDLDPAFHFNTDPYQAPSPHQSDAKL
jgi:hypothetical protein